MSNILQKRTVGDIKDIIELDPILEELPKSVRFCYASIGRLVYLGLTLANTEKGQVVLIWQEIVNDVVRVELDWVLVT